MARFAVVTDFLLFVVFIAAFFLGALRSSIGPANSMRDAFQLSGVAHFVRESVNPMQLGLLSPLLPADVRASG